MRSITKKGEIEYEVNRCLDRYAADGVEECARATHDYLLSAKIKFPLLEFAATIFHENILPSEQIAFCDAIANGKTIGGNVILGKMLQLRLQNNFKASIDQAMVYIPQGAEWYVADIIGERVIGMSLLMHPVNGLKQVKRFSNHSSLWVIRSLGAGAHYAIKKGLDRKHVHSLFEMLITMAQTKERQIKQGIGWAAKTTARFHPDIIEDYFEDIETDTTIPQWFSTKIKIGLDRNKYAKRISS